MCSDCQQRQGEDADGTEPLYELKPQIKHLCHVLDGLIFVVDASESKQSGKILLQLYGHS